MLKDRYAQADINSSPGCLSLQKLSYGEAALATHPFCLSALLLLMLPWLNPFAMGPSPGVTPWLAAIVCETGALGIFHLARMAQIDVSSLSTSKVPYAFCASVLTAGLFSSVLALLQYFDVEVLFALWINLAEPAQAFANLRQRNQFASLTNMALAVLLAWAIRQGATKVDRRVTVLALAAALLLAVGNAASASCVGAV